MRHANTQAMRDLWVKVIMQAVRDALANDTPSDRGVAVSRREASAWLRGNSSDFRHVCSLAGFDPDMVKEWWERINGSEENRNAVQRRMRDSAAGAGAKRRWSGVE